ncbi:hypothetical protein WG66_010643 [Moniliophthora roreri]|nr:hypothetical protein WG66_010643 [Moniliophthora roreri]
MATFLKTMGHWGHRSRPQPQDDLCEACGTKPKFIENGYQHPYCSRTCAKNVTGDKPMACILGGCQSTGKREYSYYCSEEHGKQAVQRGDVPACEGCNVHPQNQLTFCLHCLRSTEAYPNLPLKELSPNDATFRQVRDEFMRAWLARGTSPNVEKIYEVSNPRQSKTRQKKYSKTIQSPAEIRTFFSAMCSCDMGLHGAKLCKELSCGVCNAIRSSFECFGFGAPYHIGRYGKGIYSYVNPARSDRFTYTVTTSPYRISVACNTVIQQNESVFVPVADAITPAFVIVFVK